MANNKSPYETLTDPNYWPNTPEQIDKANQHPKPNPNKILTRLAAIARRRSIDKLDTQIAKGGQARVDETFVEGPLPADRGLLHLVIDALKPPDTEQNPGEPDGDDIGCFNLFAKQLAGEGDEDLLIVNPRTNRLDEFCAELLTPTRTVARLSLFAHPIRLGGGFVSGTSGKPLLLPHTPIGVTNYRVDEEGFMTACSKIIQANTIVVDPGQGYGGNYWHNTPSGSGGLMTRILGTSPPGLLGGNEA